MSACDLCKKSAPDPLESLKEGWRRAGLTDICSACSKRLNDRIWKMRAVADRKVRIDLYREWKENSKK